MHSSFSKQNTTYAAHMQTYYRKLRDTIRGVCIVCFASPDNQHDRPAGDEACERAQAKRDLLNHQPPSAQQAVCVCCVEYIYFTYKPTIPTTSTFTNTHTQTHPTIHHQQQHQQQPTQLVEVAYCWVAQRSSRRWLWQSHSVQVKMRC